jgi:hypothetical protein
LTADEILRSGKGVHGMRAELKFTELDLQEVELLPAREALGSYNWAAVYASNTAVALNAASYWSTAKAVAVQEIEINQ